VQSYYAACQAQRTPKSCAVIVGLECDNLSSVAREIDAVASRVRGAAVYLGADIAGVITALQSAALIHIASHGLFRSDDPSSSMLFLGSDVLTVRDISQLDLQAELITLSACSTGRGTGRLEGFMRAFTVLGIPSLVASFWDVNDESTALLMNAFYSSLAEQPDIAQALRDAMFCVRNHSDDPYHWAPFSLIGRTRLREPWKSFHNSCTNLPMS
jgi:CHAT domain-containing protein